MNQEGLKPTEYVIEKVVYWSTPERCFIITQVYAEVCLVHAPLGAWGKAQQDQGQGEAVVDNRTKAWLWQAQIFKDRWQEAPGVGTFGEDLQVPDTPNCFLGQHHCCHCLPVGRGRPEVHCCKVVVPPEAWMQLQVHQWRDPWPVTWSSEVCTNLGVAEVHGGVGQSQSQNFKTAKLGSNTVLSQWLDCFESLI